MIQRKSQWKLLEKLKTEYLESRNRGVEIGQLKQHCSTTECIPDIRKLSLFFNQLLGNNA
ncbi:hypothetical protein A1Q_3417 [Vibrio campbellii HY01]|nr:hypothetical protein A1Q_3417 [Vibrio campbellii HY01]